MVSTDPTPAESAPAPVEDKWSKMFGGSSAGTGFGSKRPPFAGSSSSSSSSNFGNSAGRPFEARREGWADRPKPNDDDRQQPWSSVSRSSGAPTQAVSDAARAEREKFEAIQQEKANVEDNKRQESEVKSEIAKAAKVFSIEMLQSIVEINYKRK